MCIWDVSRVTDFDGAFSLENCGVTFSDDAYWDTHRATTMRAFCAGNSEFKGDVSTFDVRRVTTMADAFRDSGVTAESGLDLWDVRDADVRGMLSGAEGFRSSLEGWSKEKRDASGASRFGSSGSEACSSFAVRREYARAIRRMDSSRSKEPKPEPGSCAIL
jgi:surface protein